MGSSTIILVFLGWAVTTIGVQNPLTTESVLGSDSSDSEGRPPLVSSSSDSGPGSSSDDSDTERPLMTLIARFAQLPGVIALPDGPLRDTDENDGSTSVRSRPLSAATSQSASTCICNRDSAQAQASGTAGTAKVAAPDPSTPASTATSQSAPPCVSHKNSAEAKASTTGVTGKAARPDPSANP
jgi:hypothetical protein